MAIFEDFETGSVGWANEMTTEGGHTFSRFLGRIGAHQQAEKSYVVSDPSKPVKLSFDFYEIDSWDGEKFIIEINGRTVIQQAFFNSKDDGSASGSVDGVSWKFIPLTNGREDLGFGDGKAFGGQWYTDQKFKVEMVVSNPGDKLILGFSSTLNQSNDDESFGIDNLRGDNLGQMPVQIEVVTSPAGDPNIIENPDKIGIGTWDIDDKGTALRDLSKIGVGWYYNWGTKELWDSGARPQDATFVPMIWGSQNMNEEDFASLTLSGADTLLGFNEPDDRRQSNMSVEEAISFWPQLMATGMRLGSPATTMHGTLGENSWLGSFMAAADERDYRVDFIAVHYYSDSPDVAAFKNFLEEVHETYDRPIWVTEWALVDWNDQDRFSHAETAAFAREAIYMLDDLEFVEQHAWFGAYEGGDGWHINTELIDIGGNLTAVGQVWSGIAAHDEPTDVSLVGRDGGDTAHDRAGDDVIQGNNGLDEVLYDSPFAAATIKAGDGCFYVSTDANGSDTLFGINRLQFADGNVALDTGAGENAGMAYRLYQAAFARTPDAPGLGHWIDAIDEGMNLDSVAQQFIDSAEFAATYGSGMDSRTFVDTLYANILGREPDASGADFWIEHIDSAAMSDAAVLAAFSESQENVMGVAPDIANGIYFV